MGIPVPRIHWSWSENEKAMREDVKTQAAEMLEAAGCRDVQIYDDNAPMGFSVHEMGPARMGRDPETSVLNAHNQAHDVPNLFYHGRRAHDGLGVPEPVAAVHGTHDACGGLRGA